MNILGFFVVIKWNLKGKKKVYNQTEGMKIFELQAPHGLLCKVTISYFYFQVSRQQKVQEYSLAWSDKTKVVSSYASKTRGTKKSYQTSKLVVDFVVKSKWH